MGDGLEDVDSLDDVAGGGSTSSRSTVLSGCGDHHSSPPARDCVSGQDCRTHRPNRSPGPTTCLDLHAGLDCPDGRWHNATSAGEWACDTSGRPERCGMRCIPGWGCSARPVAGGAKETSGSGGRQVSGDRVGIRTMDDRCGTFCLASHCLHRLATRRRIVLRHCLCGDNRIRGGMGCRPSLHERLETLGLAVAAVHAARVDH